MMSLLYRRVSRSIFFRLTQNSLDFNLINNSQLTSILISKIYSLKIFYKYINISFREIKMIIFYFCSIIPMI